MNWLSLVAMLLGWYTAPEWWLCILGFSTLIFVAWQAAATARAAKATEESVKSGKDATKRQLRAYLAVTIGPAVYQERRDKSKGGDLMFAAHPILTNTGQTPAHKIKFTIKAALLSVPLPKEVDLPETGDKDRGESVLGVQQNVNMVAIVEGFCLDEEVQTIKKGINRSLYVWGLVTYEDVFGEAHLTRFCQQIYWDGANNVRGFYTPGRNEAT